MTKEEKAAIIGELTEKFAATPYFYITDTAGLTVAEVNVFRKIEQKKAVWQVSQTAD